LEIFGASASRWVFLSGGGDNAAGLFFFIFRPVYDETEGAN